MPDTPRIVLFREKRVSDPYEDCLRASDLEPVFLPVLAYRAINHDLLADALSRPEEFSGLVITSERGADRVLETIGPYLRVWQTVPIYAVGPRTSAVLSEGGLVPGETSIGSGAELARHILTVHTDLRPLLFPCSSRRRDDLPDSLARGEMPLHEIAVYETTERPVPRLIRADEPAWTVFFSPSAVDAIASAVGRQWPGAKRAAIGPTTADALRGAGLPPHAVADAPRAESLVEAIRQSEKPS